MVREVKRIPPLVFLMAILALFSGGCALAYEILFMRALTTLLGDMFYVHAALLATFLAGIGLGARYAWKYYPLLWLWELLTGLYALGLPVILKWVAGQQFMLSITASPLLTVLVTVSLIVLPGILIGFSIPLFSAYVKERLPERLSFQGIYLAYNFGAFLSIFLVELLLVRLLGVRLSLAVIGGINLFTGLILLVTKAAPLHLPVEPPRTFPPSIVVALVAASLCSALFQMFFLKLSNLVFQPHRENFAVALAVILLGIFLGAFIASRLRLRFESLLIAGALMLGLIYVNYLPLVKLFNVTLPWARSSDLLIVGHKFLFGCIFALAPMIVFGALLPALMRSEKEVAGEAGFLLYVSSLANAAGYLLYVFVGHPLLSSSVLLVGLGALLLLASLLAARFSWQRPQGMMAALSILLMVLLLFTWQEKNFYLAQWVMVLKPGYEVKVYKSGAESATFLRTADFEWISYNGQPSIFVKKEGRLNYAEMISGVIPALSAPRLDKVLVLGFGTGITPGAISQIFSHTDVVEINRAFYLMMPEIAYANQDIASNRAATLHLADARAFLTGKEREYDAIINSVSAPTYYSASKIYTVEFYQQVARALKPDGVFCLWFAVPEMSEPGVHIVLSALYQSFTYCDLRILEDNYYLVTCSNQRIKPRKFSDLPLRGQAEMMLHQSIPGFKLNEFFEDIRLSEDLFEYYQPEVTQENTDDHPVLEFVAVRRWLRKKSSHDLFYFNAPLFNIDPVREEQIEEPARLLHRAGVMEEVNIDFFDNYFSPLLKSDKGLLAGYFLWKAERFMEFNRNLVAQLLIDEAIKLQPGSVDAYNCRGKLMSRAGRVDKAIQAYKRALQFDPACEEAKNKLEWLMKLKSD